MLDMLVSVETCKTGIVHMLLDMEKLEMNLTPTEWVKLSATIKVLKSFKRITQK